MDFSGAKDTYRENAVVQKKMADKLVFETIKIAGKNFENVFETGAGTGLLTDKIVSEIQYKRLFLNDITENFTGVEPFKFLKGDILDINKDNRYKNKFNLIMSNAMFQWIEDRKKLFSKLYELLAEGGFLAFTTFGEKNFSQIKETTGFSLDYSSVEPFIKEAGFEILYKEEELQTLYFESVRKILEHIKLTGTGKNNRCLWTKNKFEVLKKEYLKNFCDDNGAALTYHPVYFVCRKI